MSREVGSHAPASAEPGVAIKIRNEPRRGTRCAVGIASPRLISFLLHLPQVARVRSLALPHSLHLGLMTRVPPGRNTCPRSVSAHLPLVSWVMVSCRSPRKNRGVAVIPLLGQQAPPLRGG